MTMTLFGLIIGVLFFQLDTDELGFTNRYVCVTTGMKNWTVECICPSSHGCVQETKINPCCWDLFSVFGMILAGLPS